MKSKEISAWQPQVWCESQSAEAVKSQNPSQVDDRISVERIIRVEGINRGYAEQLSSLRLMQTKPLVPPCSKEPRVGLARLRQQHSCRAAGLLS